MILDIILVIVLLLGGFIGYKKGFVSVVIKLGTVVIAFILALLLKDSVSSFISDTLGFGNTIAVSVEEKLVDYVDDNDKKFSIPLLNKALENIDSNSEQKKTEVIEKCSGKITDFVINGISFIVIFVVVAITMGVVSLILNTVVSLPVLKTLNGTLGAVIEIVLIAFVILICLAIISFLSPLEILNKVTNYINQSCITKWIYENNIIVSIIGSDLLK